MRDKYNKQADNGRSVKDGGRFKCMCYTYCIFSKGYRIDIQCFFQRSLMGGCDF